MGVKKKRETQVAALTVCQEDLKTLRCMWFLNFICLMNEFASLQAEYLNFWDPVEYNAEILPASFFYFFFFCIQFWVKIVLLNIIFL